LRRQDYFKGFFLKKSTASCNGMLWNRVETELHHWSRGAIQVFIARCSLHNFPLTFYELSRNLEYWPPVTNWWHTLKRESASSLSQLGRKTENLMNISLDINIHSWTTHSNLACHKLCDTLKLQSASSLYRVRRSECWHALFSLLKCFTCCWQALLAADKLTICWQDEAWISLASSLYRVRRFVGYFAITNIYAAN
jgi:hypothetical protein